GGCWCAIWSNFGRRWRQASAARRDSASVYCRWRGPRSKTMRRLHELPKFRDRWSYLYLERGRLDQDSKGLIFHTEAGDTPIPIDQLSLVMLGPGTTLTHAAVKALAENACLVAWVGENGVRMYAHSTGATFSARRLLHQARLYSDETLRLAVVYRMYQKRFPGTPL